MVQVIADYVRLLRAATTLVRHDVVLPENYQSRLPFMARMAGRMLRLFQGRPAGRPGERLTQALEKLGPVYIKLGQFLATRPDMFGIETTTDLSRLKDKLPAFAMPLARDTLEREFGKATSEVRFADMSPPVAAASLAQVHRLNTPQGAKAVKILRPGIEGLVDRELRAMRRAAHMIERVSTESQRFRPVAFIDTVAISMRQELDMRLEAGGADMLRQLATAGSHFEIPGVDWTRTSQRVLTTDWVAGVSLTDPSALDNPAINRSALANDVTRGFLSHAIGHGVFHADMHEGNIIVTPDGRLALVDFGLIGRIGMKERRFLVEILWGFINRDYQRAAEVHFRAGYVPPGQSVGAFSQALRSIGEPIHGQPARDISMGDILLQLVDFTRMFGMQMRPELVLLQKTMVQVEGVARSIDPDHDIWAAAEPVIRKWISRNPGATQTAERLKNTLRRFVDDLSGPPSPPPPQQQLLRTDRSGPIALIMAVLALIVAVSGWSVW